MRTGLGLCFVTVVCAAVIVVCAYCNGTVLGGSGIVLMKDRKKRPVRERGRGVGGGGGGREDVNCMVADLYSL